jgi:hypothetical protein
MKKLGAIATAGALLAACATTSGYEAVLNTWIGDTSDHLVSVWGVPMQTFHTNDGGAVLEYQRSGQIVLPGLTTYHPVTTYNNGNVSAMTSNGTQVNGSYNGTATTYVPQTSDPIVIPQACMTRFTVDASGRITRWSWQGNACRAKAPPPGPKTQSAAIPTYQKCSADQLRSGSCT